MAKIHKMRDYGGAQFYPEVHEKAVVDSNGVTLDTKLDAIVNRTFEEAWDGSSTPDVAKIPAGVVVTYNSQSYTGTLAASAATAPFIYMVADGNGNYDRYVSELSGSSYVWKYYGNTEIVLDDYAKKEDLKVKGPDLWEVTMPNGYLNQSGTKVNDSRYDSQQLPLKNGATYYVVPQVTEAGNNARLFRVEGTTYTQEQSWKTSLPFSFTCPATGNYVLQNIIYKSYSLIPPSIYEIFEMGDMVEELDRSNQVLEQVDRDNALLLSQIGQTGRAGGYINSAGNYIDNDEYFCTPPIPFSGTEIGWHWHSQEMNTAACVVLFNSAGTKLDYWGASAGIRGRTITTNKASAGCYLVASFKVDSFQDSYLRTDSTIPWKGAIFTEYEKFKYSGVFFEGIIHRGYSSVAPENTLVAFALAKTALYAKFVETDIEFTSDDVPVLLHDSTINRTARNADGTAISGTVNIADITYEQALEYDFGIWKGQEYAGTKIPTLDEFLQLCKVLGLVPLIELKDDVDWTSERVAIIAASVKRVGMQKTIRFGSFSPTVLGSISAYFPNARLVLAPFSVISGGKYTSAVISQLLDDADTLASAHNNEVVLSTHYGYMSTEIYNTIAARGYNTYSWTINDSTLLANLDPNIVGVMSDSFDAARYVVDNLLDSLT